MNNNLSFNEFGTLLSWKEFPCLYPFTKTGESFRGGAFWCIPNQGPTYDVFEVQNGEYRKTLSEKNSTEKHLLGAWGELTANLAWETTGNTLTTKAVITSLKDGTLVRPGFHPYFAVSGNFSITIGHKTFNKEILTSNGRTTVVVHTGNKAVLEQESGKTEISFNAISAKQEMTFTFCIWTDDKEKYVCIEPVIGKDLTKEELFDGSPAPLVMKNKETLTVTSTITVLPSLPA
jgi:galactose mutarotase-like enzyme